MSGRVAKRSKLPAVQASDVSDGCATKVAWMDHRKKCKKKPALKPTPSLFLEKLRSLKKRVQAAPVDLALGRKKDEINLRGRHRAVDRLAETSKFISAATRLSGAYTRLRFPITWSLTTANDH